MEVLKMRWVTLLFLCHILTSLQKEAQLVSTSRATNPLHELGYTNTKEDLLRWYKQFATLSNSERTGNPATPNSLNDDVEDVLVNFEKLEKEANELTKKKGKDKPLLRRKSELPHDMSMIRALDAHKRSEEFLSTSSENSFANT